MNADDIRKAAEARLAELEPKLAELRAIEAEANTLRAMLGRPVTTQPVYVPTVLPYVPSIRPVYPEPYRFTWGTSTTGDFKLLQGGTVNCFAHNGAAIPGFYAS